MTTDISKLKIAPDSKFFKVENGEILFKHWESKKSEYVNLKDLKFYTMYEGYKYLKQLISAVGVGEWYKRFYESDIQDEVASAVSNKLCMDQIELWKGLADE